MRTSKIIFNALFLSILIIFFCMIGSVTFARLILFERFHFNNNFMKVLFSYADFADFADISGKIVDVNWETSYPFKDSAPQDEVQTRGFIQRYSEAFLSLKQRVESYATDHLLVARPFWVGNAYRYDKTICWKYNSLNEIHGLIQLSDGHLATTSAPVEVDEYAKSILELSKACEKLGVRLIYINVPEKICKYEDADVNNILSFSNNNTDRFLSLLNELGVENYDVRDWLHQEGLSHHAAFYRTDLHWRPEASRWAAQKIATMLNENKILDLDLSHLGEENFSKTVFPNNFLGVYGSNFLGNYGRKGTLAIAAPEDFSLLYPNFQTLFHYEIPTLAIEQTGDFSIMYNISKVLHDNYYQSYSYDVFIYGNQALERIDNKEADNQSHVLFVHDSFGNPLVPFFAISCKYTDSIDLRRFTGSLQSYIDAEKPNVVIVMYHTHVFNDESQSLRKLFTFR